MATHFARGILSYPNNLSPRLSAQALKYSQQLPSHKRNRFLASRSLLAELMFMLYGIAVLPEITCEQGRPCFASEELPDFSVAYAGNWAGVVVATEGKCGLDMELQRTIINTPAEREGLSSNEIIWINNQTDPKEAWVQILAVRQSLGKLVGQPDNITHELQLLPGVGRLRFAPMALVETICDAEDLLVWSVAGAPAAERLKLWEFDTASGWRVLKDLQERAHDPDTRLMRFTSMPADKALIIK